MLLYVLICLIHRLTRHLCIGFVRKGFPGSNRLFIALLEVRSSDLLNFAQLFEHRILLGWVFHQEISHIISILVDLKNVFILIIDWFGHSIIDECMICTLFAFTSEILTLIPHDDFHFKYSFLPVIILQIWGMPRQILVWIRKVYILHHLALSIASPNTIEKSRIRLSQLVLRTVSTIQPFWTLIWVIER